MKELDKAIAAVLGQDVFDGLKAARVGTTRMHDMAIRKAFVDDCYHPEVIKTLREYAKHLDFMGVYPYEPPDKIVW